MIVVESSYLEGIEEDGALTGRSMGLHSFKDR